MRDQKSVDWDPALSRSTRAAVSFDPAFDYARRLRSASARRERSQLALALRVPPATYLDGLDQDKGGARLVDVVARALNLLLAERPLMVVGCVMHTGFPESDDHAVYARIRERLDHPGRLSVTPGRHTVADVVHALETSQAALTVRFHGMILALAAETPFVAIDYARPSGKVSAAAALAGRSDSVVRWDALDARDLADRLQEALDRTAPAPEVNLGGARDVRLRGLRALLH